MVYCTINLENSSVYLAGQLLRGNVELHLNEPRKIRAFWINIYGTARCLWTKQSDGYVGSGKNRRRETHFVNCEGKEVYLNQKHFLFGNDYENAVEVASGTHTYEFSCLLPAPLPASLRLPYGTISYEIEAVLDIPWSFNKEFKREFVIVRNDDFSDQPDLKMPSKSEEIKNFCCFCCESAPLIVTVTLPQTGFLPGQVIPISIEYVNKSDVSLCMTKVHLSQVIKYKCQTPEAKEKEDKENVLELDARGVAKNASDKIDVELTLPAHILPTNTNYCSVIEVSYTLNIMSISDGCHLDVDFTIPITIGSTPKSENYIFGNVPSAFSLNVTSHPTNHSNFSNLPPPSFDEAVGAMKPLLSSGQLTNAVKGDYGWSCPTTSGYPPIFEGSGYPPVQAAPTYPPVFGNPGYPSATDKSAGPSAPPE